MCVCVCVAFWGYHLLFLEVSVHSSTGLFARRAPALKEKRGQSKEEKKFSKQDPSASCSEQIYSIHFTFNVVFFITLRVPASPPGRETRLHGTCLVNKQRLGLDHSVAPKGAGKMDKSNLQLKRPLWLLAFFSTLNASLQQNPGIA